ncbi:hypothetical protein [Chitinophaga agri]|uniref:Uncharacterized protein n=1 Tax=Chitinophaga agri TaxID=2703787 RepID=A0A6B9ZBU4_9BACT|nr:hypothetical protein [Chitinophaga agri]QHS58784.1 hypothetical protein GWR21_03945 [Chitinophaga agri]
MKFLLSVTFALLLGLTTFAQNRPAFPALKAKEDYAKAEPLFQQLTEWITETDLDKQKDERLLSNGFLMEWLTGSPTVTVQMGDPLLKVFDKNPQLLMVYMANYASYCISKQSSADKAAAAKAGLLSVIRVYQKGLAVVKNKALEKVIAANDDNKLDEYIDKNFKKQL